MTSSNAESEKLMRKITTCNTFDQENFIPFFVNAAQIGWIDENHIKHLAPWKDRFSIHEKSIFLSDHLDTYDQRTQAINEVIHALREKQIISDWRSELYPASLHYGQEPLFSIERSAAPFFGIRTYGTHLNGYSIKEGQLYYWISKRADHLAYAPNKLDNLAAGGLPMNISPKDNITKEAWEEAKIPPELSTQAKSTGTISYIHTSIAGTIPDTLFIFDLELPTAIQPEVNDDEVSGFELIDLETLYRIVVDTDQFKVNSVLVAIDFLIRHGFIQSNFPDYSKIVSALHRPVVSLI